jgi:hypothetical protein
MRVVSTEIGLSDTPTSGISDRTNALWPLLETEMKLQVAERGLYVLPGAKFLISTMSFVQRRRVKTSCLPSRDQSNRVPPSVLK